ncbi:MAG: fasciclin domain-containing protein, partial [Bacteroidota bacterium]
PSNGSVTDLVVAISGGDSQEFSSLLAAIQRVDSTISDPAQKIATILGGDGPFTVFAPTNAAFQTLFDSLGVNSVSEIDAATLQAVLLYHVVQANAKVYSTDLMNGAVTMLDGNNITIDLSTGVSIASNKGAVNLAIPDAMVTGANVIAGNGVVHIIDQVLLP